MSALAGPFAVVAAVLVVSGVAKLASPEGSAAVLRALGLPSGPVAGRAVGSAEVAVGVGALLVGGRVSGAIVAGAYLAFAGVVVVLLRRGGVASCGCFGERSAPPTLVHLGVDLAAACIGLAAAVLGVPSLPAAVGDQPALGVPFLALVALGTWLTVMTLTVLPATLVAARRTPATARVQEFALHGPLPGASAPPSPRPAP